jgi:hypothetical protein
MQPAGSSLWNRADSLAPLHRGRIPLLGWLLCWAAILVAGLWPLEFHPRNTVQWLQAENGIRFDGKGIVFSPVSLARLVASSASRQPSLTLELLLRPRRQESSHEAYIVSDDGANRRPGLALLQYGPLVILQGYFRRGDGLVFGKVGVAFVPERVIHIAVTSGAAGTELYMNGLRKDAYAYPIALDELTGPLVLGNSGDATAPWSGDLLGLALYDSQRSGAEILNDAGAWMSRKPDGSQALALYEFTEKSGESAASQGSRGMPLQVPRSLVVLERRALSWNFRRTESDLWDLVENVAGFVPFGFFAAAVMAGRWSRRASTLTAILVGFALSFFIETVQIYLPMRDSSAIDLLANTVGAAVGAVLLAITWRHPRRSPGPQQEIPSDQR